jgi:nucleotide-binding universal stress UspA family protein
MNGIQRILCPVDFSETSDKAFTVADSLAQRLGAELVLLHAFEYPEQLTVAAQERPLDPTLKPKLEGMKSQHPSVKIQHVLHAGPPGEVICWIGQTRGCDLIVMGTHGRTGLMHLLLGSVAEHVVRHARSPVMTVRNRPADEPPLKEPLVLPVPPPRFM